MAVICPSYYRGEVARFTRLDVCGRPVYGPGNQVVTDGFVSVTLSPNVEEGDAIQQQKANGKFCINVAPCPQVTYYDVEIQLCEVDPSLMGILQPTWEPVCDEVGDIVGFDAIGDMSCDVGYAMELWMGTATDVDACTGEGATGSWGYLLVPRLTAGAIGDIEVGSEAITFTVNGRTKRGSSWGRGPYRVQLADGVPARLNKKIGRKTDFRQFVTTAPPPIPACGAQPVDKLPADPADLVFTRLADDTLQIKVDNHGSGPVMINWGDTPALTQEVKDGAKGVHKYTVTGTTVTVTVEDKGFPGPGSRVTRSIAIPLTPGTDKPTFTFTHVVDSTDPTNPNCVQADVVLGAWAVRSNAEAQNVDACAIGSGGALVTRPDVWIDWGDGSKPEGLRLAADGTGSKGPHCYARAGYYTVTVSRDDDPTLKTTASMQVPAPSFRVAGVEQSRDANTITYDLVATGAEGTTVTFDYGDGTTSAPVPVSDGTATGTHTYTRE